MKYKLPGIVSLLLAMAFVLGASAVQRRLEPHVRVHHHLSAPEKAACTLDHSEGELCTHLPLLVIDTGGQEIPGLPSDEEDMFDERIYRMAENGESMITVRLAVFDSQEHYNHPSDAPTLSTDTQIRVRGYSSRRFAKTPYLIKLLTDEGTELHAPLLGMAAHNEWALHGPYLDKSLLRNYLFYNLSGEIMDYAPNCRFCELILDGEYRGVYLLTETITAAKNGRLPITMSKKNNLLSSYLLRIDRPTEADFETLRDVDVFSERSYIQHMDVQIRYPGKNRLTEEMKTRIERDFSAFEKALYSYDFDSDQYGFRAYVDVDSFAAYYIINAFSGNADAGRFSTYIYKTLDGRYKLCVWDFNNACDNYVSDALGPEIDIVRDCAYFNMMFRDPEFVERVIVKYRELREGILSDASLDAYIDGALAFLGDAIARDSARWALYIASDPLLDAEGAGRNPHSQAEAVEQLKDYLHARGKWLDENIDYLRQYCAFSANKSYSEISR